jgi:predicted DNA binding CopG/RHH family protein
MKRSFNVAKGKKGFVTVEVKRDKRIVFRLTEAEELEFRKTAKSKGLTGSDYIRLLLEADK